MFRLVDICEDVRILNILARNGELGRSKEPFYQVKNALMEHLYKHGKCTEVRLSVQNYPCWSCDGTGEFETGEDCFKCNGTGIYRSHNLLAMIFEVGGHRFRWHIPASLTEDWNVILTEERQEKFVESTTQLPKMKLSQIQVMLLRAWIGCKLAGIDGLPPLKAKGWLRRRIWRAVHRAMGMIGDAFQKVNLDKVAWWFYSKRARIWRLGYGD